ncbi:MAG: Crp/Fnr family transcriptional regulator [Bacteroidetes bacterium]|nr:Crp/Fnr family transcriptional regulator [Bacteroidota bacterium]
MLSQIFQFFKLFRHLSLSDLAKLQSISRMATYKEGELIAKHGDRFPHIIAIRKGIIRTYELKSDGEERTTRLAVDGDITSCSACFMANKPSEEYLEAVEDCKVILISMDKFKRLAKQNIHFMSLHNEGLEDSMLDAIERIRFFIMMTPEERYAQLLRKSPHLIQRVPQKYLASYLGVTTVSLSRIRKRISESG